MSATAADSAPLGWSRRLRHSLRWRLVALFLLLAGGTTLVFLAGTRALLQVGWRELGQPLLADYVDRLAAEIGSPPSVQRAQALADRLPLAIRIDGPQLHWDSRPERPRGDLHGASRQHGGPIRALLTRDTAEGYRIEFGLAAWPGQDSPEGVGWLTLAGLLVLTGLAFGAVRRLLAPLDDIRSGALRYLTLGRAGHAQSLPTERCPAAEHSNWIRR